MGRRPRKDGGGGLEESARMGEQGPKVSVVMLTCQRPQYISRAIESVQRQEFGDWELIVVQDGTHPETARVVEEWEAREGRIRYFQRPKAGNIAEATNFALRQARGEYIAILDDDDWWAAGDKLGRQVRFLEEHPDYVACGGGAIVVDAAGREKMRYLKPETDSEIRRRALYANPIVHSSAVYRREAAERCGLYEETLAGFQDWDFWLRMGGEGKLYNFPDYLVCYQLWEGGGSFQAQKENTRSALRIVRRHRKAYRGFAGALGLAVLYYVFARLPLGLRKLFYQPLSRLKKAAFSGAGTGSGGAT